MVNLSCLHLHSVFTSAKKFGQNSSFLFMLSQFVGYISNLFISSELVTIKVESCSFSLQLDWVGLFFTYNSNFLMLLIMLEEKKIYVSCSLFLEFWVVSFDSKSAHVVSFLNGKEIWVVWPHSVVIKVFDFRSFKEISGGFTRLNSWFNMKEILAYFPLVTSVLTLGFICTLYIGK